MSGIGVTAFGVIAVTFMMATYAAERRHRAFVLAFAVGCLLSSVYGFLAGAWPFGVVEIVWAGIATRRFQLRSRAERSSSAS
ncbi:MAG TPA: hypothetical protein VNG04_09040 [Candidatus Acidoferrum sp.]|nr:hypothetical protein [Candidatus Acidoferrum sp.]